METLRNAGIVSLSVLIVLGGMAVYSAISEQWALALLFSQISLIVVVVTVLLTGRHVTRHVLTAEQKTRLTTQTLAARVKDSIHREGKARSELRQLTKRSHQSITALQDHATASDQTLHSKLEAVEHEIQRVPQTVARSVQNTTRDSTRQIEAMLQIYHRYPELKLPMPNTGGFAIDAQALGHLLTLAGERKPRRILELGSGTSTIWLGYVIQAYGGHLISLDHLEKYLELTRTAVSRHELSQTIECRYAPLEDIQTHGKTFNWYTPDAFEDLHDIDMLIADGPPAATGPQARFPSLPMLLERLAPNVTVILDDAHRRDEQQIVEAWLEAYPEFKQIEYGTSRLAVLQRSSES